MRLAEIRGAMKLSQRKLDRLAGLPEGTVRNIETGRVSRPVWSDVQAITEALRKEGMPGLTPDQIEFGPSHEAVSR